MAASSLDATRTGTFRGAGTAEASAARTVRRCTPCHGLIRDYFPKGTDLGVHGADCLAAVAAVLNDRPRKTLGWDTPQALIALHLAAAH